jgi:hypothetical protein
MTGEVGVGSDTNQPCRRNDIELVCPDSNDGFRKERELRDSDHLHSPLSLLLDF